MTPSIKRRKWNNCDSHQRRDRRHYQLDLNRKIPMASQRLVTQDQEIKPDNKATTEFGIPMVIDVILLVPKTYAFISLPNIPNKCRK